MRRWQIGLVVAFSLIPPLQAAPLLHALTLRELSYQADVIVVAAPTDVKQLGRFRVSACFKGKLQRGQEIQVEGLIPVFAGDPELPYKHLAAACLYLSQEPGGESYRLAPTGLICLSRSDGVFRPLPGGEPSEFRLHLRGSGELWEDQLGRVREELAEVQRLQHVRDLPAGHGRNQALLDWLQRHGREVQEAASNRRLSSLDGGRTPLPPAELQDQRERGWGELERLPFLWILDSGVLTDCWRASDLYAEINAGECLGEGRPIYCSRTGRDFLVQIALDDRRLEGSRRLALRLLASSPTLRAPNGPLDAGEQTKVLERLRTLLQAPSATTRGLTALAVREVSKPLAGTQEFRKELLPALVQAYRAEKPGSARDALAETVRLVGGVEHWKELTGRSDGLAAYLQDLSVRQEQLHFWLSLRTREHVKDAPVLVLERLGPDGKVVEKKTVLFPALQPTPEKWKSDWDSSLPLYFQLPVKGFEVGNWRMVAEGATGKDLAKWQSEPRLFQVSSPQKPGPPQPVNPQQAALRIPILAPDD